MGIGKLKFDKDWRSGLTKKKAAKAERPKLKFEIDVIRSEDLPKLLNSKEAGDLLRMHHKTVEELRRQRKIQFIKRGGRYFTTAEWIAEYLENETRIA